MHAGGSQGDNRQHEEHQDRLEKSGSKVDLYGWTTKQMYPEGSPNYYGINISTYSGDYGQSGDSEADWGSAIDDKGTWRTLSNAEWVYLLYTRTVNGGGKGSAYSAGITYGGKVGLVIYPDDYTGDRLSGTVTELPEGVVFLPAAGFRRGSAVNGAGEYGYYWTSTAYNSSDAWYVYFIDSTVEYSKIKDRFDGQSVRLVADVTE